MRLRNMVLIEMRRAFKNKKMVISLLIGCGICLWHYWQYVRPLPAIQKISAKTDSLYYPITVFSSWIGGNSYTLQQYIYFILFPVLAVIPFGASYYEDKRSGEYKNIITRIESGKYLFAKFVAVFFSAGFAAVFPLVLNLLMTAVTVPSLLPQPVTYRYGIDNLTEGYQLFFQHPYVYLLICLLFDFIFAGIIAGIALGASSFAKNICFVWIAPFVTAIFLMVVFSMGNMSEYAPVYYLNPAVGQKNILVPILQMAILLGYTIIVYLIGERNCEDI